MPVKLPQLVRITLIHWKTLGFNCETQRLKTRLYLLRVLPPSTLCLRASRQGLPWNWQSPSLSIPESPDQFCVVLRYTGQRAQGYSGAPLRNIMFFYCSDNTRRDATKPTSSRQSDDDSEHFRNGYRREMVSLMASTQRLSAVSAALTVLLRSIGL